MKSILIVDDAKVNIDILIAALGGRYRIGVALNGENALKLAKRNRPDLILLDVVMPEMDGYEVCRRLKEEEETAGIPVIFATALDEEADRKRFAELGAAGSVAKPFETEELLELIESCLRA